MVVPSDTTGFNEPGEIEKRTFATVPSDTRSYSRFGFTMPLGAWPVEERFQGDRRILVQRLSHMGVEGQTASRPSGPSRLENLPLHGMAIGRRERSADPQEGDADLRCRGKLVQRSRQDNDGNKRQSVEIQVQHEGRIFSLRPRRSRRPRPRRAQRRSRAPSPSVLGESGFGRAVFSRLKTWTLKIAAISRQICVSSAHHAGLTGPPFSGALDCGSAR